MPRCRHSSCRRRGFFHAPSCRIGSSALIHNVSLNQAVPMTRLSTRRRFPAGRLLVTPNAQQTLPASEVQSALSRHLRGDWGDCGPDDAAANDRALDEEGRLFSVYHTRDRTKFWKRTAWPRPSCCRRITDDRPRRPRRLHHLILPPVVPLLTAIGLMHPA